MQRWTQEPQSDFAKQYLKKGYAIGLAEGRAIGGTAGRAEALLRVLADRGLEVTSAQQQTVLTCANSALLDQWLDGALGANSVDIAVRSACPTSPPQTDPPGQQPMEPAAKALYRTHDSRGRQDANAELFRSFAAYFVGQGREGGLAVGRTEGHLAGRAHALLRILTRRNLLPTPHQTRLVRQCTDLAQFDRWTDQALRATSLDQVFDSATSTHPEVAAPPPGRACRNPR